MPRYFFALIHEDSLSLVDDEVGEEFDHLEAARRHAMAVTHELTRNESPLAFVGCHISVVDEQGVVVFKVPLYSEDP